MPDNLFEASNEYSEEWGFRTLQELILDLLRKKVIEENSERYKEIENRMKSGKGVKRLNQKQAINYLRGL